MTEGVWKLQGQHHHHRSLNELPSEGSFGFSTSTVLTFCAHDYFRTEGQVTDFVIRDAVYNHGGTESSSIKVISADTLSGGDTEICSEHHANHSGVESATFNGTQYIIEIFNGEPLVGSQYETSADQSSAQIDYVIEEEPHRFLLSVCQAAGIHTECGLARMGFLVIWEDSVSAENNDAAANGAEEQGADSAFEFVNKKRFLMPWWGWLIYAAIIALCFGPIFISVWRWRREFVEKESKSAAIWSSKPPVEERLSKIYSPQWGMTEVDFKDEDDYYENNAVAIEMGTMGREYECSRQSQIAAGGENTHPDISNLAWGQVQQAKVVSGGITSNGTLDIDEFFLDDDVDITAFN